MVEGAGMTPLGTISLTRIQEPRQQPPAAAISRWTYFVSMPHHVLFTLGSIQAVLVMLWWLADLGGRYGDWYIPVEWSLPSPWVHLYLMVYGLFPLYMFGFLMTTYPKWMSGAPVPPRLYQATALLLAAGVLLGYIGLCSSKTVLLCALALHLTGWAVGLYALLNVYKSAQRPNNLHVLVTSMVLATGWLLLLLLAVGFAGNNLDWVTIARSGGVWWFLFPAFFAVSHRLIPFFSSVVLPNYQIVRPDRLLWLMTAGSLLHGLLEVSGKQEWTWLVDLPMAGAALWLSYTWCFRQSFQVRILAMLHMAFVWAGFALLLFGLQSIINLADGSVQLGRAPLHALLVGYFASMLVAMSTRVSLGHSGRPLSADNMAWSIFLAVQVAALLRVAADFPGLQAASPHLILCAAALWLVAFAGWMYKFIPLYFKT